ncbi:phage portal protein [Papillibacter cinnamivorans]|nr:phage portal protein [Papillibacter cinnamivorans]
MGFGGRVKAAAKILMTGSLEDYRAAFIRGDDLDGWTVDAETAMKYSAVNACIRVLSETFASVPIILYQKTKDGRDPSTDLAAYDVLHNRPNEEMAPFNFNETMMTNFCSSGNIVCERLYNRAGELVGLYPYSHRVTNIGRNRDTKKLEYKIGAGPDSKTLNRSQVLHVPNLSFDGVIGMSPLTYAAETIRLGLSYEKYGVKFYNNAAMPSGVFEHPGALGDEAYKRLKKDLTENYIGLQNTGTPMILEENMKWQQVTISPVDAQLLESKYFQIEDICRIFRVPQHLVNKLDRSTNNNIEHQSLEFVMYTMLPIYKRFEDNINMQLLSREDRNKGYYFEYKLDGLLRGDALSRAQAYAQARQWGWMSVNDILRLENKPGIGPSGDIYLQPSNMVEAGSDQSAAQNNARLIDDIQRMISERR